MKVMFSARLDEELVTWVYNHAGEGHRTAFVEELLVACRDRRLIVTSEPAPYDACAGSSADFPALVCKNPK